MMIRIMRAMTRKIDIPTFQRTVLSYYRNHGRHDLPWRKTTRAYRILVSEMMLQQTQVPRVIEKYRAFTKQFPSTRALAAAPRVDVVRAWSGLGYNRRARFLHEAARTVVSEYHGRMPKDEHTLQTLPGVGEYTARAVMVFAYNAPLTLIETNVRTVFLHHFFPQRERVHDREFVDLIEAAAAGQDPRTWHAALMDYGSHLKQVHGNASRRSAQYAKQQAFEGSVRQVRGAVVRALGECSRRPDFFEQLGFPRNRLEQALQGLMRDEMVVCKRGRWYLAG